MNDILSESELYRLLGNDRRRAVLRALDEMDEVTLDSLVDQLVDETPTETVHDGLARSLHVSLQQAHLPKLAACGVVEFDGGREPIRRGPRFEQIRLHLLPTSDGSTYSTYLDDQRAATELLSRLVVTLLLSISCFVLGIVVGIAIYG